LPFDKILCMKLTHKNLLLSKWQICMFARNSLIFWLFFENKGWRLSSFELKLAIWCRIRRRIKVKDSKLLKLEWQEDLAQTKENFWIQFDEKEKKKALLAFPFSSKKGKSEWANGLFGEVDAIDNKYPSSFSSE